MSDNIDKIANVERLFTEPGQQLGNQINAPSPLSDYFEAPALVVLGDPGAGKTTSFEEAASIEPNAEFITIREFLTLTIDRYRGKTLYLDALDEMRGRTEDGQLTVDKITQKLDRLGCPPFRISCRAADWYGTYDSAILNKVSPNQKIKVLNLEPLRESDIVKIIADFGLDADQFIREAETRGILELLENPQTLLMIAEVVKAGTWPKTKAALFNNACELLCKEVNKKHRLKSNRKLKTHELLIAAGQICATVLCSGVQGVAFDEERSDNDFININLIGDNVNAITEVARRRLFKSLGLEKVIPIHRTIAEYLAARYLCNRVLDGLPLGRILALITGHDGGTLSDLRGLFAWLACICQLHSETLIRKDPLGIILYGDPSLFSPSAKNLLMNMLAELAKQNPWFRSESWATYPFGSLGTPDMESVFQEMLTDKTYHPVAVSCILDAISHGQAIPSLSTILLATVRDESREDFLREKALKAFINISPDQTSELIKLLEDIHSGTIPDAHCELRALLLNHLYPEVIGPTEIIEYLVEDPPSFIGKYAMWVSYDLLNNTDPSDIPVLLDAASVCSRRTDKIKWHSWIRVISKLLHEGVAGYRENISVDRLYRWLGLALDQYGRVYIDKEQSAAIREWLISRPNIVQDLYHYWLSETQFDELRRESYRFKARLLGIDWPSGFGQWFLEQAATQENDIVAHFLFQEGVQLRTIYDRLDAPTVDDLYNFVGQNPGFRDALKSELYAVIEEWRWEQAWDSIEAQEKQETDRTERVRWLKENLDQVRTGEHKRALTMLAKTYFCLFSDVNEDLSPYNRIASITNDECAEAAFEGLVACLNNEDIPDSTAISESHAKNQIYPFGYAVLAGMSILADRSMSKLLQLPERINRSALAFHLAMDYDEEPKWINALFKSRLSLVSEVLEDFWRFHLSQNCEYIEKLYLLPQDTRMSAFAGQVSIRLLRDFPNCKERPLSHMVRAALKYSDKATLLTLCRQVLSQPSRVSGKQRILWYATAFALNSKEFSQKIKRYIGGDQQKAAELLNFLRLSRPENQELVSIDLSLSALADLILICGSVFHNTSDMDDSVLKVRGMINQIADNTTQEAKDILEKLKSYRALGAWRDLLSHAAFEQIKRIREVNFKYPSVNQVIATLKGGKPANPSDLQAIIFDHLATLRDDIQHGPTDSYKTFWNVDSYGRPVNPRPENDCRDRLLERLRERLAPLDIAAEKEGHYAADKRSDIKILYGSAFNLPIEIKRHYHIELWEAPNNQLRDLYSKDPGAGGRGIYLVFWFGIHPKRKVPKSTQGIESPTNAIELEKALLSILPAESTDLIKMIVIDCSNTR
jgi:hypothetical protein